MGRQGFAEMKKSMPIERDQKSNEYVRCIADALLSAQWPGSPSRREWEVVVFKDESANAFALPGKKIGVHTGILKVAKTPGQLAAVIGHEIGHVIAEHGNERVSEGMAVQLGTAAVAVAINDPHSTNFKLLMAGIGLGAQFGVLLPHSRTQESEADIIGLQIMAKAGFDPRESMELWKSMAQAGGGQPPEFLSTHPSHSTRIQNLEKNIPKVLGEYEESKASAPQCKL